MPYRLVLLFLCVGLTVRYAFEPDVSPAARGLVVVATLASLFLPDTFGWYVTGILAQLAIGLFVLLHLRWTLGKKQRI